MKILLKIARRPIGILGFLPIMFIILVSLISISISLVKAEETAPIKIRTQVDKAKLSTSDDLTFTMTIDYQQGVNFDFPEIGGNILGMRIVQFGSEGPEREEGRLVLKKWYKLQADVSGSYILPAVEVPYTFQGKKGVEQKKIKTSEIFIEVVAPKDQGNKERGLRDIKGIISTPRKLPPWWVMVLILVFLSLCAYGYWFWFKKKKKPVYIPPIPPYERAEQNLDSLSKGGFLEKGELKYFHFSLSEILRRYLEEQFNLSATDMTTEEIKEKIRGLKELSKEYKEDFLSILKATDLVKYTDQIMSSEKSLELLNSAKEFVYKTRPAMAAEPIEQESVI